jgi:hypothetical protein
VAKKVPQWWQLGEWSRQAVFACQGDRTPDAQPNPTTGELASSKGYTRLLLKGRPRITPITALRRTQGARGWPPQAACPAGHWSSRLTMPVRPVAMQTTGRWVTIRPAWPPHSRTRAAHESAVSFCKLVKARLGCLRHIAVSESSSDWWASGGRRSIRGGGRG